MDTARRIEIGSAFINYLDVSGFLELDDFEEDKAIASGSTLIDFFGIPPDNYVELNMSDGETLRIKYHPNDLAFEIAGQGQDLYFENIERVNLHKNVKIIINYQQV